MSTEVYLSLPEKEQAAIDHLMAVYPVSEDALDIDYDYEGDSD